MNQNENELEDTDESFPDLNELFISVHSDENEDVRFNAAPVEEKVKILLNMLSSNYSYEKKRIVTLKLKSLFTTWISEHNVSNSLINESKSRIIGLLVTEQNETHQTELVSMCISLIEFIDKDKINKWEVISEIVIACVASNKYSLTKLMSNLVIASPNLFGNDENSQLLQYRKFLVKCLRESYDKPKVTIFGIGVLQKLYFNFKPALRTKPFSKLVPLILVAVEDLVPTADGEFLLECIKDIFFNCRDIFQKYLIETIRTLISLLHNANIQKLVINKIYLWFEKFICCYRKEIEQNSNKYVPIIIDNILSLMIESYPARPDRWFRDHSACSDTYLSPDEAGSEYLISRLAYSLRQEAVQPFLSSKVEELLKSSDWRHITTALDCMIIIAQSYGQTISDPLELFGTIIPSFPNDNPIVMYSAIRVTKVLCELFREKEFSSFHREALSLIIESTAKQSHPLVKRKVLYIVGVIVKKCPWDNYEITSNGMIKIFLDIMEATTNSNDDYFIWDMTRSILRNIENAYKLMGKGVNPYIPIMISQFLKMFDKLFFLSSVNDSVHDVIKCLVEIISYYTADDVENVLSVIVAYIDSFNTFHNLPSDNLDIQPCFFALITSMAKYKTKCLAKLLPKLGSSLVRFLSSIRQTVAQSHEMVTEHYIIPRPFGCDYCFTGEYDAGLCSICALVSAVVENYSEEFSPFVEIYLDIVMGILVNVDDEWRYVDITKSIYRLLSCAVLFGDASTAKEAWNTFIKSAFLQIMGRCSSDKIFKLINNFTKCVTIPYFDNALSSTDFECVGEIFENSIAIVIQFMCVFFPSEKRYSEESSGISEGDIASYISENSMSYELELGINKLQKCVHNLLKVYRAMMISAIVPMFKNILEYQPTKQLEILFKLLISVLGNILECIEPDDISSSQLLQVCLDFALLVLPKCTKYDNLLDSIPITFTLKKMFPTPFRLRFERLDPVTKSKIEKLLMSNNNFPRLETNQIKFDEIFHDQFYSFFD